MAIYIPVTAEVNAIQYDGTADSIKSIASMLKTLNLADTLTISYSDTGFGQLVVASNSTNVSVCNWVLVINGAAATMTDTDFKTQYTAVA